MNARSLAIEMLRAAAPSFVVLLAATPAAADDDWFIPVGVNVGAALHAGAFKTGALVGAEASFVHASFSGHEVSPPNLWAGVFADGVYDAAATRGRVTLGPEVGYAIFGVDGGFVAQAGGGAVRPGVAIRPMISLSVITFYGRIGFVPGDPDLSRYGELGLLLKFPIKAPFIEDARHRAEVEARATLRLGRWWIVSAGGALRFVGEVQGRTASPVAVYVYGLAADGSVVVRSSSQRTWVIPASGAALVDEPLERPSTGGPTSAIATWRVAINGPGFQVEYNTLGAAAPATLQFVLPPMNADPPPL